MTPFIHAAIEAAISVRNRLDSGWRSEYASHGERGAGGDMSAGVDILAHPGMISRKDAELAVERGVRLEISGRKGHSLTNGHVVRMARDVGAKLSYGTDLHTSSNLFPPSKVLEVLRGAGLQEEEASALLDELKEWLLS